jgi:hypothetical protein
MALDFSALDSALASWLAAATGLPVGTTGATSGVYNDDAKVGSIALPYVTFKASPLRKADGASVHDEITQEYISGNPNGSQIVWTLVGRREFTVSVDVRTKNLLGAGTAEEVMSKIESAVQKPSRRDAFNAAGLAFLGYEAPIHLTERAGVMGMARVVQDFYFAVVSTDTDTGTWIETVATPVGTLTP